MCNSSYFQLLLPNQSMGLSSKKESLLKNIDTLKCSVFMIQETKFQRKGLFKANDYEIFEQIRSGFGGSLLTGVHKNLNPVLINDGSDDNIEIRFYIF